MIVQCGSYIRCDKYDTDAKDLADQMANPRGQQRDKPFRDALRMEVAAAGEDLKELRKIARTLLNAAVQGDIQAVKEVADRLDGKPAQESNLTVDYQHDRTDYTRDELAEIIGLTRAARSASSNGAALANGRRNGPH